MILRIDNQWIVIIKKAKESFFQPSIVTFFVTQWTKQNIFRIGLIENFKECLFINVIIPSREIDQIKENLVQVEDNKI